MDGDDRVAGVVLAAEEARLFELGLNDFAYSYILWFAPLVLLAVVLGDGEVKPAVLPGLSRPVLP